MQNDQAEDDVKPSSSKESSPSSQQSLTLASSSSLSLTTTPRTKNNRPPPPPHHNHKRSAKHHPHNGAIVTRGSCHSPRHHHHHVGGGGGGSGGNYTSSTNNAFKRVTRASRHAALTTKQAVWDSNELSIEAAVSAVDQWESGYNGIRSLLVKSVHSAKGLYRAAKDGAGRLEHGLLMPVRDWILLPAFGVTERVVGETVAFLQSEGAHRLAAEALLKLRGVPVLGDTVLAPTVCFSLTVLQKSWDVIQYPIPSRERVRSTVDWSLTTTKWALTLAAREIFLYCKRADANITRTLSHTQWKVLGSGPYFTLNESNRAFIIDHLCERYFSLATKLARYELAAHIKRHNPPLYADLVLSGLLRERGGPLTQQDVWLTDSTTTPIYFVDPYLLGASTIPAADDDDDDGPSALWFRWPHVNGKPPSQNAPWICFRRQEQLELETAYRSIVRDQRGVLTSSRSSNEGGSQANDHEPPPPPLPRHPTIAQWYNYDRDHDVMVDEQRYSVSFFFQCPRCRQRHWPVDPPLVPKAYGEMCRECEKAASSPTDAAIKPSPWAPPAIAMTMRPNFWRFYGDGDDVRRAVWFLDTARHGLQPLDDEACFILEDAYLCLMYLTRQREDYIPADAVDNANTANKDDVDDESILTVEVSCPDGTERLVQFSSLTQATAIQKGMGAFALFKRRVFRGSWLKDCFDTPADDEANQKEGEDDVVHTFEDAEQKEEEEEEEDDAFAGATLLVDTATATDRIAKYRNAIACPLERLKQKDMMKQLQDLPKSNNTDHLCLIVHGIGEMMRSIDLFGLHLPNLSSVCASMRSNHAEIQYEHFAQPQNLGRIEFLPVEWHETFSILTQRRAGPGSSQSIMISDISLRTIPNMREFANDTLMDVLFFMSPEHHDIIIDVVTNELNIVVEKFRRTTGFTGKCSIIGHSLGSVISWDILNHQLDGVDLSDTPPDVASVYSNTSLSDRSVTPELTSPGLLGMPPLRSYPRLSFKVQNFFLLGSPVPVFLMIRNQSKPLSEDFSLPGCSRVFAIHHPYDPVAYRLEPCIDPRNADFEPALIKHWNGGLRVQYRTKRLWRKLLETTSTTQRHVAEALEHSMAVIGLIDSNAADNDSVSEASTATVSCVTTGSLNEGRRIDYSLQEKEIENANEYVSALAAHSSYWIEKDLSLFIGRQIYLSTIEDSVAAFEMEAMTPEAMTMYRKRRSSDVGPPDK